MKFGYSSIDPAFRIRLQFTHPSLQAPVQVKCQRAFTNRKKEFPLLTDYVSVLENIGDRANTALEQMEIYQVQDLLENLAHNFEKV